MVSVTICCQWSRLLFLRGRITFKLHAAKTILFIRCSFPQTSSSNHRIECIAFNFFFSVLGVDGLKNWKLCGVVCPQTIFMFPQEINRSIPLQWGHPPTCYKVGFDGLAQFQYFWQCAIEKSIPGSGHTQRGRSWSSETAKGANQKWVETFTTQPMM